MRLLRFLSTDNILQLHADTLHHEGGLAGVRDIGLLESATMMPQQQFSGELLHKTIAEMAAAYLFHLCKNHPFNDGNKRVAALSMLVFLGLNGVKRLPTPRWVEVTTLKVAAGSMSKAELTAKLKSVLRRGALRRRQ